MKLVVKAQPPQLVETIDAGPVVVRVPSRPLRVLDFDVECRPLHWIANDFVSKEVTAVSWAWVDDPTHVTVYLLGQTSLPTILKAFVRAYNEADLVTGHYIRGFDLPLLNGALTEFQLPVLGDKMTHDTKLDLTRRHGISSSQESISSMLDLRHPKVQMNQTKWRAANRLTRTGLKEARKRVTGDVKQHIEMRARLMELGYLAPPQMWRSGTAREVRYTP